MAVVCPWMRVVAFQFAASSCSFGLAPRPRRRQEMVRLRNPSPCVSLSCKVLAVLLSTAPFLTSHGTACLRRRVAPLASGPTTRRNASSPLRGMRCLLSSRAQMPHARTYARGPPLAAQTVARPLPRPALCHPSPRPSFKRFLPQREKKGAKGSLWHLMDLTCHNNNESGGGSCVRREKGVRPVSVAHPLTADHQPALRGDTASAPRATRESGAFSRFRKEGEGNAPTGA